MVFLWIVTILGCLAGGIALLDGLMENSAPKQGAGAALAAAFAIVPYVFTRSVEGLRNVGREKNRDLHDKQMAKAAEDSLDELRLSNGKQSEPKEIEGFFKDQ